MIYFRQRCFFSPSGRVRKQSSGWLRIPSPKLCVPPSKSLHLLTLCASVSSNVRRGQERPLSRRQCGASMTPHEGCTRKAWPLVGLVPDMGEQCHSNHKSRKASFLLSSFSILCGLLPSGNLSANLFDLKVTVSQSVRFLLVAFFQFGQSCILVSSSPSYQAVECISP